MHRLLHESSRSTGTRLTRRTFAAAALALSLALAGLPAAHAATAAAAAAADDEDGPRQLLITYRSEPRDRPAFRAYLSGEGRAPFDRLVRDGALKDYQILFNPFVGSYTWDAMVVLDFRRFADTRRWSEIERVSPGGLSARGLKLARPVDTYSADLGWQGAAPGATDRDSVFYVIPYDYASASTYRSYVNAYVIPQVEGWMREGVLTGYRIYMNRYPVGKPWDSLFVYQYRDLDAFGRRDATVMKVRETLKADPAWQKLNETKQAIRTESENTITEALGPSGPAPSSAR
jgi:hypothetical protein